MRVLILGGSGMLGHKLWQLFSQEFDTYVGTRKSFSYYSHYVIFQKEKLFSGLDAFNFNTIDRIVNELKPDVIVNTIGIIKQHEKANNPIYALTVNSIFPHKLNELCMREALRLIHLSTDCVFSGRKGKYTEEDESDATDLYGISKYLGEVNGANCMTIRTSIIGRELNTQNGLLEWFLSNAGGTVRGCSKAIFSGFPTIVFAEILVKIIREFPNLSGVWNVSSNPISKFDLLRLIANEYDLRINIEPFSDYPIDRSLDSSRFRNETGIVPSEWPELIKKMKEDPTPYNNWRKK